MWRQLKCWALSAVPVSTCCSELWLVSWTLLASTDTLDKTEWAPLHPDYQDWKNSQVLLLRRVGHWRGKTQNDLELHCLLLADSVPSLAQIHLGIIAVFQRVLLWTQAEKSQVWDTEKAKTRKGKPLTKTKSKNVMGAMGTTGTALQFQFKSCHRHDFLLLFQKCWKKP